MCKCVCICVRACVRVYVCMCVYMYSDPIPKDSGLVSALGVCTDDSTVASMLAQQPAI